MLYVPHHFMTFPELSQLLPGPPYYVCYFTDSQML